jgi:hypothetical protein
VTAELHLAENALALHLLLERLECLIDVIVADKNLHACFLLTAVYRIGVRKGPLSGFRIARR